MKTFFKVALAAMALVLVSGTNASAQKFGYINSSELLQAMPEMTTVITALQAFEQELLESFETIQVERNRKIEEYNQGQETLSATAKRNLELDIQSLETKLQTISDSYQSDMSTEQQRLLSPVMEKANDAIEAVAKAQSLTGVFDTSAGALLYFDSAQMVDILAAVRTQLGI